MNITCIIYLFILCATYTAIVTGDCVVNTSDIGVYYKKKIGICDTQLFMWGGSEIHRYSITKLINVHTILSVCDNGVAQGALLHP